MDNNVIYVLRDVLEEIDGIRELVQGLLDYCETGSGEPEEAKGEPQSQTCQDPQR